MPIVNADVAGVFEEIADLLEVQGANSFRVRAYRNAAHMLGELGTDIKSMIDRGADLDALPGIGPDLAGKICEVVRTGHCALLDELRTQLPPAVTELLKIPGIGAKRARALHQALGIRTLQDLHRAAEEGRLRTVQGIGPKMQQSILEATTIRLKAPRRYKLSLVTQVGEALRLELSGVPGVLEVQVAGSLRRQRETVGDLDMVAAVERDSAVMDRFVSAADGRHVLIKGPTRASIVLASGLQVDLRAVPRESFGAAWLYFTGSKAHNIALRQRAREAGLKLNEYGVFRGDRRIAGDTEASVYHALGLPFIEPELREQRGEIDAALSHSLPALVQRRDLRGDLHAHTRESDGRESLEAMAAAARARGLEYLAITDHSPRLALAHGLDAGRLAQQIDRIDELNARVDGIVLLKGIEVDILEDGRLDLVVGAIHHRFDLSRDKQTDRLLRAMDHPCFSILAHPTARLIDERPGCDFDLPRVIRKARERGCFLELNAHPARLDLNDVACRMAKDEGVLVSIASDAHSSVEFDNLRFGIGQARRGWLESSDVLNTRRLGALRSLLSGTMDKPPPAHRVGAAVNVRKTAESVDPGTPSR
ncbi:MAG: DNA polymerase/3'-5' exonuclease PolX [Rhodoferax sp.]|nr:DNA polymerase/3'-5' exonuclease PolX [Rhodoferax sp.]